MTTFNGPMWKDGMTPKKRRAKRRRELTTEERAEKDVVRERDRHCRFPLCGCQEPGHGLKSIPTVSHDIHKGMGGDPSGKVSIASLMILLCKWRHQDGHVSRHAGTLQTRSLTPDGNDGPLAWLVDMTAVRPGFYEQKRGVWFEVAREQYVEPWTAAGSPPGTRPPIELAPLTDEQRSILEELAEMRR